MTSKNKVSKLFEGWKKNLDKHKKIIKHPSLKKKETKKPIPLMIFSNITRNGMMSLTFNQDILVPSFIEQANSSTTKGHSSDSHRHLEHLDINTIDVSQIFNLKFVLKSKTNPKDIKYSLELMKWDEKAIQVFINFTNPLLISQGNERDTVFCIIQNPDLFVSKENGEHYNLKFQPVIKQTIPS